MHIRFAYRIDLFASICYNIIKYPRKDIDYMAKKNTKRGFTLVELIVVLVILAVLAALLIPALTGYIDKARKRDVYKRQVPASLL